MNGDNVNRAEFIELRATIQAAVNRLDERLEVLDSMFAKFEPILLQRSGDLARVDELTRDVAASHEKHRGAIARFAEIDKRIDRVEARQNKIFWMVMGAIAVLEVVARALPDGLLAKLVGG